MTNLPASEAGGKKEDAARRLGRRRSGALLRHQYAGRTRRHSSDRPMSAPGLEDELRLDSAEEGAWLEGELCLDPATGNTGLEEASHAIRRHGGSRRHFQTWPEGAMDGEVGGGIQQGSLS